MNEKLIKLEDLHRFDNLEILAKQVVEGTIIGLHKSPFHGFSAEFAEHRLWNQGDPVKSIDWKVYGRTDKLFIKRFEEETNLRCRLVVDVSSSMNFPIDEENESMIPYNKLGFSIASAACFMHIFRKQRDAVSLSAFGSEVEVHTKAKSTTVHHNLLMSKLQHFLDRNQQKVETGQAACLHEIAENTHRRSLVIVFSDMLSTRESEEELFGALQHLRHNKHEVIMFHVIDKRLEVEFEYDNRPYHFIDLESGEEIKLESNRIKKEYKKKMEERFTDFRVRCAQYRIDFVAADINQDFTQILLPYLAKRGKMNA